MELTKQMFIDGTIDAETVKVADLKAFCESEGFDINCAPRRGRKTILNDIVDAVEKGEIRVPELTPNKPETITASIEPEPEMSKVRDNGEVIKLAKDGKDYGANLLNRLH